MSEVQRTTRLGVDVGGTFTDLVLHDPVRNIVRTAKLLTTPEDPSAGIISGVVRLLREAGVAPARLHSVVHGTTLITNTIIERTGATVGLVTTAGFRDSIEVGRETRYDLYDLFLDPAPTLVPRHRRLEVPERVTAEGVEALALDEAALERAARQLVERERCDSLAIAFLHSYSAPAHEGRAAAIVRRLYPNLPLSLSSEVAPEIREFERTSTTCANAYVQPLAERYLDRLEKALAGIGFSGRLYIMLSGGGITTVREAKQFPIRIIESGPAAGAMAASFIAKQAALEHVISFDMGGTTAKICLIEAGAPDHKFEFEAGRVRRFRKGSGLPLKISTIDMIEIGAGGGSLASVDPGSGLMKVGPRSAGAKPGPICYGQGGTEPTVTDADLVLGRLNPEYFLGGEMALDQDRVSRGFAETVGRRLSIDAETAALGVQRIIDETMASAARMHLAEKGKDPRKYTLIAFGGAGPVHASNLARLLKVGKVVIPLGAGVASALGFLVAPPATDLVTSYTTRLERADWRRISALFSGMRERSRNLLTEAGADPTRIVYRARAEMRHVGQGYEIGVPLPRLDLSEADLPRIRAAFFESYRERFGRTMEGVPIEVLTWRLASVAPSLDIRIGPAGQGDDANLAAARKGVRKVLFEPGGWQKCTVYDRYKLPLGASFTGPALVEERESTCVIGGNTRVSVDAFRNLVLELVSASGEPPRFAAGEGQGQARESEQIVSRPGD